MFRLRIPIIAYFRTCCTQITWHADGSVNYGGWEVCLVEDEVPPTTTTASPTPAMALCSGNLLACSKPAPPPNLSCHVVLQRGLPACLQQECLGIPRVSWQ
eukprot:gene10949-biopygen8698